MKYYTVIMKDEIGWRLHLATLCNQSGGFTLDDGRLVYRDIFPATTPNLRAMSANSELTPIQNQMYWPLELKNAIETLESMGYGVDKDLRIYCRLVEPFTLIKAENISVMLAIHLRSCTERNKNPETEPIFLAMQDDQIFQLFKGDKESGMVHVVSDPEHKGKITMYHRQICLSFQDYHLIPKSSNVLWMHKFLSVEEGPETLEQLFKQNNFIDKDGVVRVWGKTSIRDISIDDFFNGGDGDGIPAIK